MSPLRFKHLLANFIFFSCIIVHCNCTTFFINHLPVDGHKDSFKFLAITWMNMDKRGLNNEQQWTWMSTHLCSRMESYVSGSCGRAIPNFLRNRHTNFHSGCMSICNLQCYWQGVGVPFPQHRHQHVLSFVLSILAILMGIK